MTTTATVPARDESLPARDESPRTFSPADLATLAELAEAFVPGRGEQRARLAAVAMESALDPIQVLQLRAVLFALRSRLANLVLGGRPILFAARSPVERERFLLRWSTSRLALWRAGFAGYRRLLTFLAYAERDAGGHNARLDEMGYVQDERPVAEERTSIRPTIVPPPPGTAGRGATATLDVDVVIVGSGAGGGVIAAELARAGRSVVVLEAGPFVDEGSMPADELAAFERLYLNRGLSACWDGSIPILAGTGVGGGTLINWMTCAPAPLDVREEWAARHGLADVVGATWDADLAAIGGELELAPATVIPPKDEVLLRGAAALGWAAGPVLRNATSCGACGSCPFGCTRGEKRSGIRAHLAAACESGARVVPDATVTKIVLERGRAVGVEATLGEVHGARRLIVRAPQVVVAAAALRTPAILERSGIDHPALGRHLRLHPVPVIAARFDERIDMWRGTMQAARIDAFSASEPGRNGYILESAPGHPGLIALAFPWEGAEQHAAMLRDIGHFAGVIAVTRDGGSGRVRLTRSGRVRIDYRLDRVGEATLRHALVRMARLARAAGAREIMGAATPPVWYRDDGRHDGRDGRDDPTGAARRWAAFESRLASLDLGPNRATVFSAHQMGTARLGADPADAVCDPDGRVRADRTGRVVDGLYVGDGSLFPTGIGVNPMITIMTLARRVARTVLAEG
ncbi:MAG: GMC family oxidoreductase [Chloroflexota bacterium]